MHAKSNADKMSRGFQQLFCLVLLTFLHLIKGNVSNLYHLPEKTHKKYLNSLTWHKFHLDEFPKVHASMRLRR